MDLYPSFIHKGDLSPDSFGSDVDHICNEIQAACKGFGTDEKYVNVVSFVIATIRSVFSTDHWFLRIMLNHMIGDY